MKFKFKIQGYQTEAVDNTTAIFAGQPNRDPAKYRRDIGRIKDGTIRETIDDDGYRNADVELSAKQLLENLHSVQTSAGVPPFQISFEDRQPRCCQPRCRDGNRYW